MDFHETWMEDEPRKNTPLRFAVDPGISNETEGSVFAVKMVR